MKAIITQYRPAVGLGGSRYTATDGDGNRVSVSARDDLSSDQNHELALRKLCKTLDWSGSLVRGGLCKAGRSVGYVWVWRQERLTVGHEVAIQ